jgi:uncharacterized protein with NAD-binding domain and iron-sulfur cluster
MSSLVTVYKLIQVPGWEERWSDITVYQMGWRLGGKGASTRSASGRVEEHGLHLLFGGYENAFSVLGDCFSRLADPAWPTVQDAFSPQSRIVMYERSGAGWEPWQLLARVREGQFPGQGPPLPFSAWTLLRLLFEMAWEWLLDSLPGLGFEQRSASVLLEMSRSALAHYEATGILPEDPLTALALARAALALQDAPAGRAGSPMALGRDWPRLLDPVDTILWGVRRGLRLLQRGPRPLARPALGAEFHLVVVAGALADRVLQRAQGRWVEDWTAIDSYDLRAWLQRHGASREVIDSKPVEGLYAAIFSAGHTVAAGSILQGYARMLHYKGAPIYRMAAGMGETIFAPLYRVLCEKVKFEFFHRVERLVLSANRSRVERVEMSRQVRLEDPTKPYQPLAAAANGRLYWPPGPDLAQIDPVDHPRLQGHDLENWWDDFEPAGTRHLEAGAPDGFDELVLGIGVGALPFVCRDLVLDAENPRFRRMVSGVVTRPTRAAQLWLERDPVPAGVRRPVVIPFVEPFDTWADMTPLLAEEGAPAAVKSLAYLCMGMDDLEPTPRGVDPDYPKILRDRVRADLERWLRASAPALWPSLADPGGFDWSCLHDPGNAVGPARIDAQYWHAPQNPSDRYVLSVAGSTSVRLRAEESGYANLWLTGDWTRADLNLGCLEGATMAGMRTARALDSRVPEPVYPALPPLPPAPPPSAAVPATVAAGPLPPPPPPRPYVVRDGEMIAPPPITLTVDPLYTFVVEAHLSTLQELCDRELNLDPGLDYRPAGSFVVFYCSRLDNAVAGGSVPEIDFGVWVPVLSGPKGAERLHAYSPYVWVDNSLAMLGGRSVFGFAKHVGRLAIPDLGQPALFSADAWHLPTVGGVACEGRLLEIERRNHLWSPPGSIWNDLAALDELLGDLCGGLYQPALLRELLKPEEGLPMVFLKQLPHADESAEACYQAVLEGPIRITGRKEGGALPDGWEVRLRRCASHDIAATLGLAPRPFRHGGATWDVLRVRFAAWMRFQAEVGPAKVVWCHP